LKRIAKFSGHGQCKIRTDNAMEIMETGEHDRAELRWQFSPVAQVATSVSWQW
jgi:hypothetical protein